MKYTIEGFSQQRLIELGLGTDEAVLLRWFVDFSNTSKMKTLVLNDSEDKDVWYWVNYGEIIKWIPIISNSKKTLQRKFFNLVDAGVLLHHTQKVNGTFSYYRINKPVYESLLDSFTIKEGIPKMSYPLGQDCPTPYPKIVLPNNSSNKDDNSNINDRRNRFVPPSVQEVEQYCKERNYGIDAEAFVAFYESKGWLIGKAKMKNWKSAVVTWVKREFSPSKQARPNDINIARSIWEEA